jgi:hypothetical protein
VLFFNQNLARISPLNIHTLDITNCTKLGDEQLVPFTYYLPNLKNLKIGYINNLEKKTSLTANGIVEFLDKCSSLEGVSIIAPPSLYFKDVATFTGKKKFPFLKEFGYYHHQRDNVLDNEDLLTICEACCGLKTIKFHENVCILFP